MISSDLKKKIKLLARKVGCPLNWKREPGLQWNGEDVACEGQTASDIIHDIAHFTLATSKARKQNDFGLGPGPDSQVEFEKVKEIYSSKKCMDIETHASALGIYWEKKFGLDWKSTARHHSWDSNHFDLKRFWKKKKLSKYIELKV